MLIGAERYLTLFSLFSGLSCKNPNSHLLGGGRAAIVVILSTAFGGVRSAVRNEKTYPSVYLERGASVRGSLECC